MRASVCCIGCTKSMWLVAQPHFKNWDSLPPSVSSFPYLETPTPWSQLGVWVSRSPAAKWCCTFLNNKMTRIQWLCTLEASYKLQGRPQNCGCQTPQPEFLGMSPMWTLMTTVVAVTVYTTASFYWICVGECISRFTSRKVAYCIKFHPEDDKQDFFVAGTSDKKIVCVSGDEWLLLIFQWPQSPAFRVMR